MKFASRLVRLATLEALLVASLSTTGCAFGSDQPSNASGRISEIFFEPNALALAKAAEHGDAKTMERLLKQGVNMDSSGKLGITPAWWAIRNRNKEGFAWLLDHGANPNPNVESITIMEMAAGYEDSSFLEIALRHKPDLKLVSGFTGKSPLNTAIDYNRQHNLELLIKAGADMNQEQGGGLPISRAAGLARYDFVFLMLKAGADPTVTLPDGRNRLVTTIGTAVLDPDRDAYEWRERVIRLLREKGISATKPTREPARTKPLPPDLQPPK